MEALKGISWKGGTRVIDKSTGKRRQTWNFSTCFLAISKKCWGPGDQRRAKSRRTQKTWETKLRGEESEEK